MSAYIMEVIIGRLRSDKPGQWVEATFCLQDQASFNFDAQMWRQSCSGDLALQRISADVAEPLTPGIAASLLSVVADSPFRPTRDELEVTTNGDEAHFDSRMLQAEYASIRTGRPGRALNPELLDEMKIKLARACKCRRLLDFRPSPRRFDKGSYI